MPIPWPVAAGRRLWGHGTTEKVFRGAAPQGDRGRKVGVAADQLGIASAETLRRWVRQAEADRGLRSAPTTEELAEIKPLRKEVADQQRTIEILKAATSFFVREANPGSS
ncbi:MAG: transposase [Acidimicrobiales bacterium]